LQLVAAGTKKEAHLKTGTLIHDAEWQE